MLAIERRQDIAKMVLQKGNVTISELVALFDVSAETIRKDLLFLEQNHALMRTHGGAVSVNRSHVFRPLNVRKQDRIQQKQELCRYALSYIRTGDVIALDTGSTAIELAKLLACTNRSLTVVTHNLDICRILSENPGIDLILCGGSYIRDEFAFGGCLTVDAVRQIHTTKAFICPSGVSARFGITDYSEPLLAVQRAYIACTDQVYILADSEKFESCSQLKICDTQSSFLYVTDSELSDEIRNLYADYTIISSSCKSKD